MTILDVSGITKSFSGLRAVDNLTFQVGEGEIVGLIGPNGAGKTTAINLISGAQRPDGGEVLFRGDRVTGLPPHKLARRGLVRTFQATNVYGSRTVRENIYRGAFVHAYPGFCGSFLKTASARAKHRATMERIDGILALLDLAQVADIKASSLPYGHQKMLGLAMALAAEARLILLDEPAAGLNDDEADHIAKTIRAINARGTSVIVVDHNMRFISGICSRIVVLHHGAELMIGTPAEVTTDPRVIEAYLGIQDEPA